MTATASAPLASAIPDIDAAFAAASALGEHQVVRFQGQAAFARALARTLKREGEWLPLVARAEAIMAAAIGGGTAALGAALAQAEAVLAPLAPEAKSFTLQCAGHAHIDMNWMWGWHETVGVTVDTFATVLNLMDEFPEFHFTQSQASVYAIIAEHHPEMLERIRARVREGRWEVAAAHWVEGDRTCSTPGATWASCSG
jgi:alpha-mannosidase